MKNFISIFSLSIYKKNSAFRKTSLDKNSFLLKKTLANRNSLAYNGSAICSSIRRNIFSIAIFILFTFCFGNQMITLAQTANDWAQFSKYENLNKQITKKCDSSNQLNVIFLGNSITELWVKLHPDFFTQNGYLGRGISGQTTYQLLLRFRDDVVNFHPKIVVINGGTNDIAENNHPYSEERTLGNLISMCEIARANNIEVILTSITPCGEYIWRKDIKNGPELIESLNKRISEYAEKNNLTYVDYYSEMVVREGDKRGWMKSEFTNDACHPTLAGYLIMENLIQKAINEIKEKF